MKTIILSLCILFGLCQGAQSQAPDKTGQVIEGGKLIVELVKAIGGKKDPDRDPGCKGHYADLCIRNESSNSISVYLEHRTSVEKREVVILPTGKECSLRAAVGVWTYDLRVTGSLISMRKGDLLIEGCNNMDMSIK